MSSYQANYGDKGYDVQSRDPGYKGSDYEVLEAGFGGLNAPQVASRASPGVDLEKSLRLGEALIVVEGEYGCGDSCFASTIILQDLELASSR